MRDRAAAQRYLWLQLVLVCLVFTGDISEFNFVSVEAFPMMTHIQ